MSHLVSMGRQRHAYRSGLHGQGDLEVSSPATARLLIVLYTSALPPPLRSLAQLFSYGRRRKECIQARTGRICASVLYPELPRRQEKGRDEF